MTKTTKNTEFMISKLYGERECRTDASKKRFEEIRSYVKPQPDTSSIGVYSKEYLTMGTLLSRNEAFLIPDLQRDGFSYRDFESKATIFMYDVLYHPILPDRNGVVKYNKSKSKVKILNEDYGRCFRMENGGFREILTAEIRDTGNFVSIGDGQQRILKGTLFVIALLLFYYAETRDADVFTDFAKYYLAEDRKKLKIKFEKNERQQAELEKIYELISILSGENENLENEEDSEEDEEERVRNILNELDSLEDSKLWTTVVMYFKEFMNEDVRRRTSLTLLGSTDSSEKALERLRNGYSFFKNETADPDMFFTLCFKKLHTFWGTESKVAPELLYKMFEDSNRPSSPLQECENFKAMYLKFFEKLNNMDTEEAKLIHKRFKKAEKEMKNLGFGDKAMQTYLVWIAMQNTGVDRPTSITNSSSRANSKRVTMSVKANFTPFYSDLLRCSTDELIERCQELLNEGDRLIAILKRVANHSDDNNREYRSAYEYWFLKSTKDKENIFYGTDWGVCMMLSAYNGLTAEEISGSGADVKEADKVFKELDKAGKRAETVGRKQALAAQTCLRLKRRICLVINSGEEEPKKAKLTEKDYNPKTKWTMDALKKALEWDFAADTEEKRTIPFFKDLKEILPAKNGTVDKNGTAHEGFKKVLRFCEYRTTKTAGYKQDSEFEVEHRVEKSSGLQSIHRHPSNYRMLSADVNKKVGDGMFPKKFKDKGYCSYSIFQKEIDEEFDKRVQKVLKIKYPEKNLESLTKDEKNAVYTEALDEQFLKDMDEKWFKGIEEYLKESF